MAEQGTLSDKEFFEANGYLIKRNFASKEECEGMIQRMRALIDAWDPDQTKLSVFRTDGEQIVAQGSDSYFISSSDKIHFFLEKGAIDEKTGQLRKDVPKHEALNKVGHGLHFRDDVFAAYSTSDKVKSLVRELGWVKPVLPQSMYIFKQRLIGDVVTSHQDATFLFTEPRQTCLGLWLALEDATLTNGCLWIRPGSHKEGLRKQFHRNPAYFEKGDTTQPLMMFRDIASPEEQATVPWAHGLPTPDPQSAGFIPAPMKAGDLFVIHGLVDHLSLPNTSEKGRQTYQLHLVEGPEEGVQWSKDNWLQYPAGLTFPPV
jgi:phytanoyl-CoA hydroxylase